MTLQVEYGVWEGKHEGTHGCEVGCSLKHKRKEGRYVAGVKAVDIFCVYSIHIKKFGLYPRSRANLKES